jgi:hypothetical protein
MNHPVTLQEIFRAKLERRKRLASLPMDQRINLIEQLHELAQTMKTTRENLRKSPARQ